MYAPKLKRGDGVRVVAPASSLMLPWISNELKQIAQERLESLGLRVSFGKYVNERDDFDSTTIEHRIQDLHDAFADDSIQLVLTVIGGFNSNQLLRYIDYDLIGRHPKILCGYSDITALATAIYAKTRLVTYSGPHFFNFGQNKNFEYTQLAFENCCFKDVPLNVVPSEKYIDDYWATNQDGVSLIANPGWTIIHGGKASGTIIGGNLATLHLLHGTEYMPQENDDIILFLEDDREDHPAAFDRNLQSLLHQPIAAKIRGLVIGRCEEKSGMTTDIIRKIIDSKKELADVPVIYGLDFGHTTPMITFPIGGKAIMDAADTSTASLKIIEH